MKKKLLFISVFVFSAITVFSQKLPIDPNVKIGKLDNGLTYYIRHNEKPEHRAEFYIAQKVGAILETPEQRGLAHFLEHMAFNGTKNFPGKNLIDFLERNGVKFGENINAGTGIEQTIYMLANVPTIDSKVVDSCILILHDWSNNISLENDEIDKERGVILEELRSRNDAELRMTEKMFADIYKNTKYEDCLPGGSPDIIANFDYQTLRDYYNKWYRPDLQGIIIVGDIDEEEVEAKIKYIFSDINAPVNPTQRTYFQVEDNIEPIVSVVTDPEANTYNIMLFYKFDQFPDSLKNNFEYFISDYVLNIITNMMNNRMQDIAKQPNPPFVVGYNYYGDFYAAETKDAWNCFAIAKDAESIDEALTTMIHENNRMKQFGFTNSEYERAKADFMKQVESKYNDREKQDNNTYITQCINHFLRNEPMLGIENEFAMYSQIMPMITLEQINEVAKMLVPDTNIVLSLMIPQKPGVEIFSNDYLLSIMQKANNDKVDPYEEFVSNKPLLSSEPISGKVVKENKIFKFDATEWILNNGLKVIYKTTDFKEDEIQMTSYSFGGTSLMDLKDAATIRSLDELIEIGGLGDFSAIELPKMLAGKKVTINPYVDIRFEGVTGKCSPKDIETMLQMIYLYFTSPRIDQEAFASYKTRTRAVLENMEFNPFITLHDSINSVVYNNHPFAVRTKVTDLDLINYDLAIELYKDRFADAKDFVFVFVGNIAPDEFKPLVEKYLASLPVTNRNETWKDNGLKIVDGNRECHYDKKVENPVTTIFMIYSGKLKYNLENKIYIKALGDIMDMIYTEKIREDEGGTYGVSVNGNIKLRPDESFAFQIIFQTNEEASNKLIDIVKKELNNIAVNGAEEKYLNKEKEFLLKHHQELLQDNSYWLGVIEDYYKDNIDIYTEYVNIVNNMTANSIINVAKQVINGNLKEVIQNGVK